MVLFKCENTVFKYGTVYWYSYENKDFEFCSNRLVCSFALTSHLRRWVRSLLHVCNTLCCRRLVVARESQLWVKHTAPCLFYGVLLQFAHMHVISSFMIVLYLCLCFTCIYLCLDCLLYARSNVLKLSNRLLLLLCCKYSSKQGLAL